MATDDTSRRRRVVAIALGALVLGLLVGGAVVLLTGADGGHDTAAPTSRPTSTSRIATTTTDSPPTTVRSATDTGTATAPAGTTPSGTVPTPTVSLSSSVGLNPSCSHDTTNFNSPTDPLEFTVSWSGRNVTQTVFAVGGPGSGPYGAPTGPSGGSVQVSYGCGNSSHQFTVTATGPNGPAQQTITVNITEIAPPAAP